MRICGRKQKRINITENRKRKTEERKTEKQIYCNLEKDTQHICFSRFSLFLTLCRFFVEKFCKPQNIVLY